MIAEFIQIYSDIDEAINFRISTIGPLEHFFCWFLLGFAMLLTHKQWSFMGLTHLVIQLTEEYKLK